MRSSQDRSLRRRDETRADSYRNAYIELLILICSIMRLRDQNCVNRETSYHLRTAHPRPDAEPAGGAVGSVLRRFGAGQTSSVLVAVLALAVSFRLEYFLVDLLESLSAMVSGSRRLLIRVPLSQSLPVFAPCSFAHDP